MNTGNNFFPTGYNYKGDISIDDVKFVDCAPPLPTTGVACLPSQFQCKNSYCVEQTHVCDMQNDCLTGEDEQVKIKELDCKLSYTILSCPFNINEQIISMT